MKVDHAHVAAALQELVGDGMQGTIGPGGSTTTEEHAVGMAVLAARNGTEVGDVAHLLSVGCEFGLGGIGPGLAQVWWD